MKKITKKEMFTQIKSHLTDANEIAFIEHEIELLENKASQTRKPNSTQIANESFKNAIIETLAQYGKPLTISEIQEYCDDVALLTNQRVSALLTQLKNSGVVVRTTEKRKAYFALVE